MKKSGFLVALFSFLLLFQNCKSQKPNPDQYQRQWMLTSLNGFSRDFLVSKRAQLDLSPTKSAPNQFRAFMGCNDLGVTAEFKKNNTVKFGDFMSTKMYCEDNKGLEKTFINMIAKMTKYKIDGHQLTLSDGKGNEMKFVAADWD